MTLFTKFSKQSVPWFWIGMAIAFLLWTSLRFWGLSRFNLLVFDEVYYAKYGNNYLTHTPFFDVHYPLGKYLIAIGIWIGTHLPFGQDSLNRLTGSQLSPFISSRVSKSDVAIFLDLESLHAKAHKHSHLTLRE
ncbi:MAG: phospholipid carrier-dependent glycosyltransferase [Tolypothrix sp. T3-bin4]|nr:phospholipid carrier-dependent glycosyltransferase [Tolypothrix sp. T3-bin4]